MSDGTDIGVLLPIQHWETLLAFDEWFNCKEYR